MTCQSCHHEFCWICFGNWQTHKFCNRFKKDDSKRKTTDRQVLEHYLHYYHRYNAHEQSRKFESKLREDSIQKMVSLKEEESWLDVSFIDEATECLIDCRNSLKFTYVAGYFYPDGRDKSLFEFLQGELESATEALSELLEGSLDTHSRPIVVAATKTARQRHSNLIKSVREELPITDERKKSFFALFKNLTKNKDKEKFTTLSPEGAHTASLLKKIPIGVNPQVPQDILF